MALARIPVPSDVARPWCHSYPPGVPPWVERPAGPLTTSLDRAARDHPVGDALVHGRRRWQWAALRELVDRAAVLLREQGIEPGDRVAVVSPATPAAVVVLFACWRVGAVAVPLDPSDGADGLATRLLATDPRAVVVDVRLLDAVDPVRPRLQRCGVVWTTDPARWALAGRRVTAAIGSLLGRRRRVRPDDDVTDLDVVLDRPSSPAPQEPVDADDVAAVLWTAGTTGAPRSVELSHGNLAANAAQLREWVVDLRDGREVVLVATPLATGTGLVAGLLTGVLVGATVVLLERPSPGAVVAAVERERVTLLPATPSLHARLPDVRGVERRDLASLRVALSFGAPLPAEAVGRVEAVAPNARLRHAYGPTEAGALALACPVYGDVGDGRIGLPVSDTVAVVASIEDPRGLAAAGEIGELLVAGPQLAVGPDEWFATGDLASTDGSGAFTLHGRVEDLVHRDGHLLVPDRVERALELHPRVAAAAVVAVTDGPESSVVAVVEPAGRRRVTGRRLLAHLGPLVAEEDLPDRVVVASLPRTPSGSVDRRAVVAS